MKLLRLTAFSSLLPPGGNEYQDNADNNANHNLGHLGDIHGHEEGDGKNAGATAKSIHRNVGRNWFFLSGTPNQPTDENQRQNYSYSL